jgi:heme-degrading monooxygenase HmoA
MRMAVLMVLDVVDGTTQQYDRTNELAGIRGDADAPTGLISHVAAVDERGVVIADVWESQEAFERFFRDRLGAALEEAQVPMAEPRFFPVHNMIPKGSSDDARVVLIVEPEEFTTERYDRLTADMDAHAGSGERHPAVAHVAGRKDDGTLIVVDLWESEEAFQRFAQEQLADMAEQVGAMEPRFAKVHNRIRPLAVA